MADAVLADLFGDSSDDDDAPRGPPQPPKEKAAAAAPAKPPAVRAPAARPACSVHTPRSVCLQGVCVGLLAREESCGLHAPHAPRRSRARVARGVRAASWRQLAAARSLVRATLNLGVKRARAHIPTALCPPAGCCPPARRRRRRRGRRRRQRRRRHQRRGRRPVTRAARAPSRRRPAARARGAAAAAATCVPACWRSCARAQPLGLSRVSRR
jgi:hypothetical protein